MIMLFMKFLNLKPSTMLFDLCDQTIGLVRWTFLMLILPVLLHHSHHRFYTFQFQDQLWDFIGAPQGYCQMPYIFTKVLKVPLG